ncbi:hypothetical protein [Solicola gregarius]|uniref:Uncharacterized protein n=1 Tax=Solicola gregarius TaxID=2908642 RepID=A0AA46TKB1_9ACTN|nr:hypothetical protein [Solicola gregarius]UYM06850.1 hypothetical protein L0C25_07175 [Solicola gregarius]
MSGGQPAHAPADVLEDLLDLDERAQLLVDSLTDEETARLLTTVTEARAEYAGALDAFAEGVVASLPRPLRTRAARILARG